MHQPQDLEHPETLNTLTALTAYGHRQLIEATLAAQAKTWAVLNQLVTELQPGQCEADVKARALSLLAEAGSTVNWHSPYVRFGPNTTCTFMDKGHHNVVLQENDLAFFDLGSVFEGVEGDVGQTIAVGHHPVYADMARQSEAIFEAGVAYWKTERPTGLALYHHVNRLIEAAGYQPNLDPAGHLIGSFPHKGVYTDGLNHYPHYPEPGIWILEIQFRHPTLDVGAFYEAVLI
ncbi:MAG: M24 family metallopeptidase [Cyanobacteria bacterium HKST-UBA05]|nr:M24 family metallopeptidase [Cyanobacteria bacterium HKST-UBA05]